MTEAKKSYKNKFKKARAAAGELRGIWALFERLDIIEDKLVFGNGECKIFDTIRMSSYLRSFLHEELFEQFIIELEHCSKNQPVDILFVMNFIAMIKEKEFEEKYYFRKRKRTNNSTNSKLQKKQLMLKTLHPYFAKIDPLWSDLGRKEHPGKLNKDEAIKRVWYEFEDEIKKLKTSKDNGSTDDMIETLNGELKKMTYGKFSARFNNYLNFLKDLGKEKTLEGRILKRYKRKNNPNNST